MANFLRILKYIGIGAVLILLTVLFVLLSRKNSKIASLELQVRELKAKLELEKLTAEYNASMKDLSVIRKEDRELDAKLGEIELSLTIPLEGVVTAEELVESFKRLGL